jgi:3-dehydro-glucose-6-phosphate--glutamate transaminase
VKKKITILGKSKENMLLLNHFKGNVHELVIEDSIVNEQWKQL